jgi:hypothetical protein
MSGCKIKRNLVSGGSGALKNSSNIVDCNNGDKNCVTEVNSRYAQMMAERDKQDKDLNKVMTEKEYEEKYGKQPVGDVKPK